jgi:glycosyltransferase involved in cell wall biosynthesis
MSRHSVADDIARLTEPVSAYYVSTYIPKKCGLATFTKDLTNAINMLNPLCKAEIIAMHNNGHLNYPEEVKYIINKKEYEEYKETAKKINDSNVDLVCLQHEFGIFGGDDGEYVVDFINLLKKPVMTTLHTVLENPTDRQKNILQKVCKTSQIIIVMLSAAKEILIKNYGVDENKIMVIHHGVPDFPRLEPNIWKRRVRRSKHLIMTSINLISPSRGLEYAIKSVPGIAEKHPHFLYLIVGETHPEYLKWCGGKDTYRKELKNLVKTLGVQKHVRFINKYLPLEKLVEYVGASDFYITPYIEKQQASSGALAYAIGAGKVCISSPYLYAKEMLGDGRGVLVPFKNSEEITQKICELVEDPEKKERYERRAYEIGRMMIWTNIAHQYFHLFHEIKRCNKANLKVKMRRSYLTNQN